MSASESAPPASPALDRVVWFATAFLTFVIVAGAVIGWDTAARAQASAPTSLPALAVR